LMGRLGEEGCGSGSAGGSGNGSAGGGGNGTVGGGAPVPYEGGATSVVASWTGMVVVGAFLFGML
jgi:hypothetical protein